MSRHNDKELIRLLEALPPAPESWVEAAKRIPLERLERADGEGLRPEEPVDRVALLEALDRALPAARTEEERRALEAIRERLTAPGEAES